MWEPQPQHTRIRTARPTYNDGSTYAGSGTTAYLTTLGCKFTPIKITGFNVDVIAEGSIFDDDPNGSSSTQAQAKTTTSLEPEGYPIQTVFAANGFRGRTDTNAELPFSNVKYNEAIKLLPGDGSIIYKLEGTGLTNTHFQLQPYGDLNAFAIKLPMPVDPATATTATATTAEVSLVESAGYKKLHLLLSGVPVHMNTFKIEFADGSFVTVNGGFDFGGSSQFEANGNNDGKSVPFVLAARNAFANGNMANTKKSFNDTSAAITKTSDQKIDPQTEGMYYHYMTAKVIDLTNITYTEDGVSKSGDLSNRPIKKLLFSNPDFTTGNCPEPRQRSKQSLRREKTVPTM